MNRQITIGSPVYDTNGNNVGTVSEQTVPGQYLAIERGVVVPGNVYVPITAIKGTAPDGGVVLNLTEDELSTGYTPSTGHDRGGPRRRMDDRPKRRRDG